MLPNLDFIALNWKFCVLSGGLILSSAILNRAVGGGIVALNALFTAASLGVFWFSLARKKDAPTTLIEPKIQHIANGTQPSSCGTQIDEASDALRTACERLSSGSARLNEAVEKTANAATLIISNVGQITIFGSSAKTAADEADEKSKVGTSVMDHLSSAMKGMEQTELHLGEIVNGMAAITTKAKFINDIVFQSKLLSFNASIEAARAGEHGKGFAVVALEVGKLAQTSGKAAGEIHELLDSNRSHAQALVETITTRTKEGKGVLEEALKSFAGITTNIGLIRDQLNAVYQAVQEQKKGAEETLGAIQRFGEIIQANDEVKKMLVNTIDRLRILADSQKNSLSASTNGCGSYQTKGEPNGENRME